MSEIEVLTKIKDAIKAIDEYKTDPGDTYIWQEEIKKALTEFVQKSHELSSIIGCGLILV